MFWRHSRALSKDTRASSRACLRLSSARRSLVCAPLAKGEHTDADASCWRRDDRVFDLVEVECAILSSRSTSSRHCFMAPGEAVELGGCRNNSLAADNAPGDALDGVRDVCTTVCCRAACTAGVTSGGQLGACGVEEAASPPQSLPKSRRGALRSAPSCLSKGSSENLMPGPYLAREMLESRSPTGWRSAPALSPEMRRGLGVSLDHWSEGEEHKNTQGFRVVRAAGA
jgi:hypothetical protein